MPVQLITSKLLNEIAGIAHGFSTRAGGISEGPWKSLNLSTRAGDELTCVQTNRRALLTSLDRSGASLITLRQVHGDAVVQVSHIAGRNIEADGVWTNDTMAMLAILTADCVPILMAAPGVRKVAAVHAGWRGTQKRVVANMIKQLTKNEVAVADLRVALGPAIGPCCFEIGHDVADQLRSAVPQATSSVFTTDSGGLRADLRGLNRQILIESGVTPEHIDIIDRCTVCDPEFFSHRRDHGKTGRQAGVIGLIDQVL